MASATSPIPFIREIDDRAYLSEMNLTLALMLGKPIAKKTLLPHKYPQSVDTLIQDAAKRVLAKPDYIGKSGFMKEITANAQTYYPTVPSVEIPVDDSIQLDNWLDSWINTQVAKASTTLMQASGWEVLPLSTNDIPPFIRLNQPIEKISCYEYALMRAGVEEAFPTKWRDTDLLDLLPKWGFASVSKEESRPGDLVLFLDEDKPVHMAIRYKKDILAKPGNEQRFAYVHKIEEAFPAYGNSVLFFKRTLLN